MNRTDRLVSMVMLLQSRRVVTAAQLAAHFEITERTVYRDLSALGEAGVPILGEAGVGYSLMRGYHLPPVMLSTEEAFALLTGGLLAEHLTDASTRESIRSSLGKLTAVMPTALQARVDQLRKAMQVTADKRPTGRVALSTVQGFLAEGRVLQIRYCDGKRTEVTTRTIEPLGLVFYWDQWHLMAWCRLRKDVRDFRVDRIMSCELTTETSPQRAPFDFQAHVAKCLVGQSAERAVLLVEGPVMEALRRQWGLAILAETKTGTAVRVELEYPPGQVDYLARWLLGLGSQVKIREPASLRLRVIAMAEATARHHAEQKMGTANFLLT